MAWRSLPGGVAGAGKFSKGSGPGSDMNALKASLGRQIATQPWPDEGDTVIVQELWDGPAVHGSNAFLKLEAGDRVAVSHRSKDGLLFGDVDVEIGQPQKTGWFGGPGCMATVEVLLPVPLGPQRPLADLPRGPPEELWPEEDYVVEGEALQEEDGPGGGPDDGAGGHGSLAPEVEAYLLRNGIDESAGQALIDLEPELQSQVISSDLTNCRNPSAVLLTRIDRARSSVVAGAAPLYPSLTRAHQASRPTLMAAPPRQSLMVPGPRRGRSRSPRRRATAVPPLRKGAAAAQDVDDEQMPEMVEEFIAQYGLDDKAAQALREIPVEHQRTFVETELWNCRNPSAVVTSRIQNLKLEAVSSSDSVEAYIQEFKLDAKVAAELQELTPAEQAQVLEAKPTNARNPSAVVTSRIQAVRSQGQVAQLVEDYLVRHGVDESVSQMLRALHPEAQKQIVTSDLSNCRNPSAVLLSRIRSVEAQHHGVVARPLPPPRHAIIGAKQPPPPSWPPPAEVVAAVSRGSAETWLQHQNVDEQAQQAMRALPHDLQMQIVERGDLINCRHPSKVLLSRIRQLTEGF
mmetsp:Transcript_88159/g.169751  ORF Transcript_88159/g.169751 Transcript_88159/m.169751 type:complete len:573 (-) Transcript_88159:116-1834(-)